MIEIRFPNEIKSDFVGYSFLIDRYHKIKDTQSEDVCFDFSNTTWFDANMLALIGAMADNLNKRNNNVKITNLRPEHITLFRKNHFLCHFDQPPLDDTYNSTVQYKKFETTDAISFDEYLESDLLSKKDFPKTSLLLRKKVRESSTEIFDNAISHGRCQNIFTCGQYYRGVRDKRLDFTIVDAGRTIRKNVRDYYREQTIRGNEAIEWAVEKGNTTKTGNVPGGLGFSLIREFLQKNDGKIQIISADGFWEEKKQNIQSRQMDGFFQGTIVNLEFNLNDKSYYYLSSEKLEGEIPF